MPDNGTTALGRLVKELRLHRGWERQELATRAGLTRVCIWKVEEGGTATQANTLLAILGALQMSGAVLDPLIEDTQTAINGPPALLDILGKGKGKDTPAKPPARKKAPGPKKPAPARKPPATRRKAQSR